MYFQNIMRKEYKRVWQGHRNAINLQRMQRNVIVSCFITTLFLVCYSVVCYLAAALVFEPCYKFSIFHRCKPELVSKVDRGDQGSHNYTRTCWEWKMEVPLRGNGYTIEFYYRLMIFSAVFNSLMIDTLRSSLHARINWTILLLMRFWKDVVVNNRRLLEITNFHLNFYCKEIKGEMGEACIINDLSYSGRDQEQDS